MGMEDSLMSARLTLLGSATSKPGMARAMCCTAYLERTRGRAVTLIGRNGAGKTTTLRSIVGILRKRTGAIRLGEKI